MSLPWFTFPDFMVMAASYFLTGLSVITPQPPLGISYTPIRQALVEAIASYRTQDFP